MSRTPQPVADLLAARRWRKARDILADDDNVFNAQLTQLVDNALECDPEPGYVADYLDGAP